MWRGISLANKCLLLFGGAVVLIVLAAMSVPWFRMNGLVDAGQHEVSRQLVNVWESLERWNPAPEGEMVERAGINARRLTPEQAAAESATNPFIRRALRSMEQSAEVSEYQSASWRGLTREYRYARAIRKDDKSLAGIISLQRRPMEATRLLVINTAYLLSAGCVVLGLAVLVFYLITHRIILSPVRALKETAERVREGDLTIRSEIQTGDEFEELSGTFNSMLVELARSQNQLRAINSALDVKLNELSEANTALYETARLKGEFLAGVSHELRTPLNSIIGFAELLRDQAQSELEAGDDSTRLSKRVRYLENILNSGRGLLEMINSLLEMARIEAGKVEIKPAPLNLRDVCEGVLGLIAPLGEKKKLTLTLEAAEDLPIIETDQKLLQQILFNFLSNAVKFTPSVSPAGVRGSVTLRAEHLPARGDQGSDAIERVRISVIDTGPGISPEDQARLFQKFLQLDASHTREHTGTGLGLAISRELAHLLQGEIQLVSEVGRGSMFSLILPIRLDRERAREQKLETAFRGALTAQRS
ncbi:MAG: HAMP domain-containing protein [Phycisphaeraceae bacterium]|nr:HAMP domain-containing protein [Phycisphaeraceae bacterium]